MPLVYLGEFQEVVVDRTKATCGQQEAVHDLFGGGAHVKPSVFKIGTPCVRLPTDTSQLRAAPARLETGLRGLVGAGFGLRFAIRREFPILGP